MLCFCLDGCTQPIFTGHYHRSEAMVMSFTRVLFSLQSVSLSSQHGRETNLRSNAALKVCFAYPVRQTTSNFNASAYLPCAQIPQYGAFTVYWLLKADAAKQGANPLSGALWGSVSWSRITQHAARRVGGIVLETLQLLDDPLYLRLRSVWAEALPGWWLLWKHYWDFFPTPNLHQQHKCVTRLRKRSISL